MYLTITYTFNLNLQMGKPICVYVKLWVRYIVSLEIISAQRLLDNVILELLNYLNTQTQVTNYGMQ